MGPEHIVIVALFMLCIVLATKLGKAQMKIDEQKIKLMGFNNLRFANQLNDLLLNIQEKNGPKTTLSSTAEKLLVLAAKSDNEGEASAAALQACKRIHKELGYK